MTEENLLMVARDFVRRSRAYSQTEDFFTEVLAGLLRLSPDFRQEFLALVLGDSSHLATRLSEWTIKTQEEAKAGGTKYGIPDLVLESGQAEGDQPSCLVAVETKLDAVLDADQLTRYDDWLREKKREYRQASLAALTTSERARRAAEKARVELEHWSAWIRWSQVEEVLSSVLERLAGNEEDPEADARKRQKFQVYGEAFTALLADEDLVPPEPLRPAEDARLFQMGGSDGVGKRQANHAHLLHQALRDSGTLRRLEDREFNWRAILAHDGLPHRTQHQEGVQLRQRFEARTFRGTFFSFGFVYHVEGWLLRDGEISHNLEHLDLAAALEVWERAGNKETNQLARVLSGKGRLVRPVDELCSKMNEIMVIDEQLFVPETNFQWAKFVCRRSTEELTGFSKGKQKTEIGDFYNAFVEAFEAAGGKPLGYPDLSLLGAIEKVLQSSSL